MPHADLFETTGTVMAVQGAADGETAVLTPATIFHPQGGGQPADTGTIVSEVFLKSLRLFSPSPSFSVSLCFLSVFSLCFITLFNRYPFLSLSLSHLFPPSFSSLSICLLSLFPSVGLSLRAV